MAKMLWGSMGSMLRALFIGTLILLLLLYTRKIFPVDASSQAARRPQDVHVQQGSEYLCLLSPGRAEKRETRLIAMFSCRAAVRPPAAV